MAARRDRTNPHVAATQRQVRGARRLPARYRVARLPVRHAVPPCPFCPMIILSIATMAAFGYKRRLREALLRPRRLTPRYALCRRYALYYAPLDRFCQASITEHHVDIISRHA